MNKTIQALKSRCLDAWSRSGPGEWCYGLQYRLSCWRFDFFQNIYSPSTFEASLICKACVTKSSVACLVSSCCFEKVKMIKSLDFPFLWPQVFEFESCIWMTVYLHKAFMITLRMLVFFLIYTHSKRCLPTVIHSFILVLFFFFLNQQIKLEILTLKNIFYCQ